MLTAPRIQNDYYFWLKNISEVLDYGYQVFFFSPTAEKL